MRRNRAHSGAHLDTAHNPGGGPVAGNQRLAALMTEAGFLDRSGTIGRKRFARAVTDAASSRGIHKTYSHTYVTRWLNGVTPRTAETRESITTALSRALGRPVLAREVGFADGTSIPTDGGLKYPEDAEKAIEQLSLLVGADLVDPSLETATATHVGAWSEASLSWLVGGTRSESWHRDISRVTAADVVRVRTTRDLFDRLDNRFGGGHARRALLEYLRGDLPSLLMAGASGPVHQNLLSAAAEAVQLAAWMSYDAGHHGIAQRYFIQALGLADAADDRLLAASILDAMSHQATFLGHFNEAANMARAARLGAARVSTPILSAHFYAMEARALARLGQASGCDRALSAAVKEFARHTPGDGPGWIQYFDEAELAAELGHCNRDLGRAAPATTYAAQALGTASGEYLRSDFFATMVLADSYFDQGEVEQACDVALRAIRIGEQLKSARCHSYVDEFRVRLSKVGDSRAIRSFTESVEGARLWSPRPRQ
jgi:tetratricopeptide (TPR) repeat protein